MVTGGAASANGSGGALGPKSDPSRGATALSAAGGTDTATLAAIGAGIVVACWTAMVTVWAASMLGRAGAADESSAARTARGSAGGTNGVAAEDWPDAMSKATSGSVLATTVFAAATCVAVAVRGPGRIAPSLGVPEAIPSPIALAKPSDVTVEGAGSRDGPCGQLFCNPAVAKFIRILSAERHAAYFLIG